MIAPVRDRRTFARLRAEGTRVRRGPLAVAFHPDGPAGTTRVAFAVTKRVGGAVQRNRLRRRLRAVLAEVGRRGGLPDGTLLVSAGPEASERSPEELRNDVERLLSALRARQTGGVG